MPETRYAKSGDLNIAYQLVGEVRKSWRGFDGGDEARSAIAAFIARLDAAAETE